MPAGTTVIITEKPDAMTKIAQALSDGKAKKVEKRDAFWYELKRGDRNIVVGCAVGHLFGLDTIKDGTGWKYPIFNVQWVPSHSKKGHEFSRKYFENMEEVMKKGSSFIVATDYDTEGAVIGYNVLSMMSSKRDAARMKFSTMTKDEIVDAYENASKHLDMGQTEAGLTRHYLDFFWGINLTRALTLAIKNSAEKGFAILSTGRVQGPTLSMLYEKELEIRKFKPKPFWELQMLVKIGGKEVPASYEEDKLWKESEADSVLKGSKGKDAVVRDVKKREYKQSPPVPFNTTDLQSECYAQFKYSPTQTLSIAESLYQKGYISYPRSSSQKLPANINYVKIISALAKIKVYQSFAKDLLVKDKLVPNEGKKDDPAHPAVYPTFETPDVKFLTSQQRRVYDLIVRRFLSVFADAATRESNTVSLDVGGNTFFVVGKRTIEPGWTEFYAPYMSTEELLLPEMSAGDKLKVTKLESAKKETQPPGRFSQGSILKEMENRNLGTKATRAEILKTLYDRNYIIGQSIKVTKLGESVIKALREYAPRILSEELTKKFEDETEAVMEGKMKREKVVEDAKETLTDVLEDFRKHEKDIGKKLLEALVESREDARRLGTCIVCKTGELKILRSRFSGKFFVGCSSYFRCEKCKFTRTACKCKCGLCGGVKGKCKCAWKEKVWLPSCQTGYPLPGMAKIVPLGKACEKCRTPMIQVVRRGKRPFRMCVDPKCETKADWGKKKTKSKPRSKAAKKPSSA